jgi:hypothetical protein
MAGLWQTSQMAKKNLRGLQGSIPNGSAVSEFNDYQDAVAYVERIILGDFPPTSIAIVGTNLTSVERVKARISYGRVAGGGAAAGVWLGLLFSFCLDTAALLPQKTLSRCLVWALLY